LLAGFIGVHLVMVALVPRSLLTMIRGRLLSPTPY
jgi:hypothetical protein